MGREDLTKAELAGNIPLYGLLDNPTYGKEYLPC